MKHNKLFYWVVSLLIITSSNVFVIIYFKEVYLQSMLLLWGLSLVVCLPIALSEKIFIKLPGSDLIENPKTPVYKFDGIDEVEKYEVKYVAPDNMLPVIFPIFLLFKYSSLEKVNYYSVSMEDVELLLSFQKTPEEVYLENGSRHKEEVEIWKEEGRKLKEVNKDYYNNFK